MRRRKKRKADAADAPSILIKFMMDEGQHEPPDGSEPFQPGGSIDVEVPLGVADKLAETLAEAAFRLRADGCGRAMVIVPIMSSGPDFELRKAEMALRAEAIAEEHGAKMNWR